MIAPNEKYTSLSDITGPRSAIGYASQPEVSGSIPGPAHKPWFPLPLIQEGQLAVIGGSMCV